MHRGGAGLQRAAGETFKKVPTGGMCLTMATSEAGEVFRAVNVRRLRGVRAQW